MKRTFLPKLNPEGCAGRIAPSLALALLWLAGEPARALNYTWVGGSGAWENTNNWSPTTLSGPGPGDNVFINSGSVSVTAGVNAGNLTLSNATLTCNNGTVQASGDASVAVDALVVLTGGTGVSLFSGGGLSVTGTLTLAGEIDWPAGYVETGTMLVTTNGLISATSSLNHYFSGNVYNAGQIRWSADNVTSGGLVLQNQSNGVLDWRTNVQTGSFGGAHFGVVNYGTMLKSAGSNAIVCDTLVFTNASSGVVDIRSGSINLNNGADLGGTILVSNNATLNLSAGTFNLVSGHVISGPGFYGLPPNANVTLNGDISDANFRITNATFYGTNRISGTVNCFDGNFQGVTTVAVNGVLNLSGCGDCGSTMLTTQTLATLTNAGTINWLSGDWTSEGGSFVNLSNALFRIECDNQITGGNGNGSWTNLGTIRKNASAGTNVIYGMKLNNLGLLDIQSGGLDIESANNQNSGQFNLGLTSVSQYGNLRFGDVAPLAGTLSVNLIGGYSPNPGDSFRVLTYPSSSGAFTSYLLPPLTSPNTWSHTNNGTATILSVTKPPLVLSIIAAGGGFNISWSSDADPGHSLKYATNLAPPVIWYSVTNAAATNGGQITVAVPLQGQTVFFGLQ